MSELDQYFVSLGVKGQNVVLKNIDEVQKAAKKLSKVKAIMELGKKGIGAAVSSLYKPPGIIAQPSKPSQEENRENKEQTQSANRFARGASKFSDSTKNLADAAASLDPVAAIQSITSATAKIAGGWSAFGFSAGNTIEGLGDLMNSGISMANSAVQSAKQSAAEQYGLSKRNVTTEYYGGGQVNKSSMTNPEHAQLTMQIAGAFGRVQKPMADAINKLVTKKDTSALGAVAGGNWESTGTDKGFMLQQVINSTQGMLPSISQKIQADLLENNADLIQNKTEGGKTITGQKSLKMWVDASESQTAKLFHATNKNITNLVGLNDKFNKIEIQLVRSGAGLAASVDRVANSISGAADKIRTSLGK